MITFSIADPGLRRPREERFAGDAIRVRSRSGLHPTERALIEHLAGRAVRHAVVTGNRTGVTPMLLRTAHPQTAVEVHAFDLHHADTLRRNFAQNRFGDLTVACTPFIEARECDLAVLHLSEGAMPGELVMDLVQELHDALLPTGTLVIATERPPDGLGDRLRESFHRVRETSASRLVNLFEAERPAPLKRQRDFAAEFEMTLPGIEGGLKLVSLPGVFAHRRVDAGGQALAEVALAHAPAGGRALDLGCGTGAVGLALARHARLREIVLVDSHARAAWCARRNAEANEIATARVLLSHTGAGGETGFDLFVGNPPYYSDYRIADLFIDTAHQTLRAGGAALLVAKSPDGIAARMEARFGNIEVVSRRGYGVVRSVR